MDELNTSDPHQLLRRYGEAGCEDAFRELTRRYVDFVYSVALRRVQDNAALAEDIVQVVFTELAKKARQNADPAKLGGWLHRHTCFVAAKVLRGERRRQNREQEAALISGAKEGDLSVELLPRIVSDEEGLDLSVRAQFSVRQPESVSSEPEKP